jgi:glucokinase
MSGPLAIGVDLGATKIAGVVVDPAADGAIIDRRVVPTPALDPDAVLRALVEMIHQLKGSNGGVRAVGIGAAGMITLEGAYRYGPNLPWRELPLADQVRAQVGLPAVAENDANVAAWGEFRFGAGQGSTDMLLVTVGTGVGGGIVIGRKLYRGAHGFAAEIGHFIVEPDGPLCGCGNRGCWEQVASGRAIDRLGREAAEDHLEALFVRAAGGDPSKVTGPLVTEAAKQGDAVAIGILEEVGRRLGQGIAGLVNILDPDTVVIGGGAVEAGDLLIGPAREAFVAAVEAPEHRPEVPMVPARLGNDAGAVGAADLALAEAGER